MKRMARWTGRIVCSIAVMIIAAAAVMTLAGARPAVVLSGSMEPTIKTGSLAIINTREDEFREKDIAAFETGGALVIHRLVEHSKSGWITKGDANESSDPWRIKNEEIKGTIVFWIPGLGYLIGKGGA
ncbi:MAG: signal peptidase I [Bacillota bacterium]|nr:signal peptidase I [Bacillota bacterium]